MSKEAYYFSHDTNARNDPKILALRDNWGVEGYGIYWVLIEMLRESNDYKLPIKPYIWNAIAMQVQCKDFAKDDAKKFVEQCINDYELLHQDAHYFWSNSLIRRMKKKDELSEKRRNAANKRWGNSSNNNDLTENEHASDMQSNASAMQVCAKESKEKEKKGKEKNTAQKTRNAYSPEFEEFWSVYPKKVDKKRASTSFKTAIKNNSLETILKGTKQYVEQIERNKTEAQYIKHASTFLNNESFLDELDEPRQQKNTPNAHTGIANDWEKLLEND